MAAARGASLSTRLLAGTALVLAAFVVLTALAVSWSVHRRAESAREERLRGLVYGILGATELVAPDSPGAPEPLRAPRLVVREGELPDPRLSKPTAGLYAEIVGNTGELLWRSRSSVGSVPDVVPTPIGEWLFEPVANADPPLERLQLQSVWELDDGQELPFIVHVVDDADASRATLRRFDRSLWVVLSAAGALLLALQFLVLRAALRPLARIRTELAAIDEGRTDAFGDGLPRELAPLASGIETLVARERARHVRYRELLDDLAHSLKTPLAILANLDDERVSEPVARMRESIGRHVERARGATTTRRVTPVPVGALAERVAASMQQLYGADGRGLRVQVNVDESFAVPMPEADLFEVVGNLVDNACKYGATRVEVHDEPGTGAPRLIVADDGPGFGDVDPALLLERGVRADRQVEGQGHGLSAVAALMAAWGGTLTLVRNEPRGARAVIDFGVTRSS